MQLGRAGVISRTRGALLPSCTQASVAEFRRETLAPQRSSLASRPARSPSAVASIRCYTRRLPSRYPGLLQACKSRVSGEFLAGWGIRFGLLEPNRGYWLSVYGTEGQRFESSRARYRSPANTGLPCVARRKRRLAAKCRTTPQDLSALSDRLIASRAQQSLDVGAEEPDMPAELDPAQHARAAPVQDGRYRDSEQRSDLARLHDVVAGEPMRLAVPSEGAHALKTDGAGSLAVAAQRERPPAVAGSRAYERLDRTQEVAGSSPASSVSWTPAAERTRASRAGRGLSASRPGVK
jgi:hypothetical protein